MPDLASAGASFLDEGARGTQATRHRENFILVLPSVLQFAASDRSRPRNSARTTANACPGEPRRHAYREGATVTVQKWKTLRHIVTNTQRTAKSP
jgi:hypothetical protein